ncbi:Dolichyl-phosphate-mannose-protein mannosyltransferase [anaerobic digester metagenome]
MTILTRIKNFLIQNKEIIILLLIYAVFYSFNLDKFPVINGDENWFINPAYDLAMFGKMGTSMIYGSYNIANFTYWQPPVFILLMATSFKLFGFGVLQARMVSVFLGFLTVLFTYQLGLKLYNKKIGLLASLAMISNPLFFMVSRNARMEIAVACFTIIALYCIFLVLKESKLGYYFASAFFAMLALLSHPNGIIAILSVVIIILAEKIKLKTLKFNLNFNEIIVFISGVILPLIPYALYISLDVAAFKGQFMGNIATSPSNPLSNILVEPTRYINLFSWLSHYNGLGLAFIVLALTVFLTVLGLYYLFRERKFSENFLLIVLMVNIAVFSVLVYHKYFIYLGLTIPYLSIIMAVTLKDKINFKMNKKGVMSVIIICSWIMLIMGNCIFLTSFLEKTKDYNYMGIEYEVQKYIPPGSVVVGDHNYWIALHDEYKYYGRENVNKTSEMMMDLKAEYLLFDNTWAIEDDHIENFIYQNCTQVGEIPSNDTNGYRTIKVCKVKKVI